MFAVMPKDTSCFNRRLIQFKIDVYCISYFAFLGAFAKISKSDC